MILEIVLRYCLSFSTSEKKNFQLWKKKIIIESYIGYFLNEIMYLLFVPSFFSTSIKNVPLFLASQQVNNVT